MAGSKYSPRLLLPCTAAGAQLGDIATATHGGLGTHFAMAVTARVTATDEVTVVVFNSGAETVDLCPRESSNRVVRAAIVQYV
eukprot:COSAG06_NODE_1799_length_8367_cov_3.030721_7_plen_83_part_00